MPANPENNKFFISLKFSSTQNLFMRITTVFLIALLASGCGGSRKAAVSSQNSDKATYGHLFSDAYQLLLDEVTFKLDSISVMADYGYSAQNPVMVGKGTEGGPFNQRRFLNALLGPNGEAVEYSRKGSCCPFSSPNGLMGGGLLDIYVVKIAGQDKPIQLYLNMYDKGILRAPVGFTFKK